MKKVALVLLLAACARQEQPVAQQRPASTPAPAVTTSATAVQEHTIDVAAEFTPASVALQAGQPAAFPARRQGVLCRRDRDPGARDPTKLAANQTITIDIPAGQPRTLAFACGMDMMKGTIVVQ